MKTETTKFRPIASLRGAVFFAALWILLPVASFAGLLLGPEELVQSGGINIDVPGYSVPSFAYWNDDNVKDLVVGEGGGGFVEGKVRVYLNTGSETTPQFTSYFYAQSESSDLVEPGSG
jgi:hypothetical protein